MRNPPMQDPRPAPQIVLSHLLNELIVFLASLESGLPKFQFRSHEQNPVCVEIDPTIRKHFTGYYGDYFVAALPAFLKDDQQNNFVVTVLNNILQSISNAWKTVRFSRKNECLKEVDHHYMIDETGNISDKGIRMWLLCDVFNADELENCKNILSAINLRLIRITHSLARAQIAPEVTGKYLFNVSKEHVDIFKEFTTILPTALQNQYTISETNRWIKVIVSKEVLKCMVSMFQVLELCDSESSKEQATEEECRICYQQEINAINDRLRQSSLLILTQTISVMMTLPPLEHEKIFFKRLLDCYLTDNLCRNFTILSESLSKMENRQSLRNFAVSSQADLSKALSLASARLSTNELIYTMRSKLEEIPVNVIKSFKIVKLNYFGLNFQCMPELLTSFIKVLEAHSPSGCKEIQLAEKCKNEFVIANLISAALQQRRQEPQLLPSTPTP